MEDRVTGCVEGKGYLRKMPMVGMGALFLVLQMVHDRNCYVPRIEFGNTSNGRSSCRLLWMSQNKYSIHVDMALAENRVFQSAAYGFTVFSIIGPLAIAGLIIRTFSYTSALN
ncbi:hypothetical protein HD806DRAFT_120787 [Xylariaceae sp. AK1471]|nr:hypothetical protein HD806DRAFT_120787 [Xylariaceae sp. AK1471]